MHESTNESEKKKQVEVMGKYSNPHNERVQNQSGKDENHDMTGYKNEFKTNKQEKSDRLRNEWFLKPGSSGMRSGRGAGSGLGARERGRSTPA